MNGLFEWFIYMVNEWFIRMTYLDVYSYGNWWFNGLLNWMIY